MNKKYYVLSFAVLMLSLMGFASYSFASANAGSFGVRWTPEDGVHLSGHKNPPSVVGVVTDIQGAILSILARDNNTYTVDASHASVVTGFIGPWGKPSSLADIAVTDTLTIKGDVNGESIDAAIIAHNRTPQNASANNPRQQTDSPASSVEASAPQTNSTSTQTTTTTEATSSGIINTVKDSVSTVVDKVVNFITGTTTSTSTEDQPATTTPETIATSTQSTTATETQNSTSSEAQTNSETGTAGTSIENATN